MARLRYSSATAIASPSTAVEILLAPPESGRALRYADLVMPDDAALSPPGVLATTPSGALPDFFGPEGDVATLYALLDDGTTVTLSLAADTGRGTSSTLLSDRKMAVIAGFSAPTVTAGSAAEIDLTGATILGPDDFYGPGTGLVLASTINGLGRFTLPDEDAAYDFTVIVGFTCDALDNGKFVRVSIAGGDEGTVGGEALVRATSAIVALSGTVYVFAGSGASKIFLRYDATSLAHDAAVSVSEIICVKR